MSDRVDHILDDNEDFQVGGNWTGASHTARPGSTVVLAALDQRCKAQDFAARPKNAQAVVLIAFDGALDPESTQRIKYEALLPALIRVYEKLGNSLPRPSRHLVLRCGPTCPRTAVCFSLLLLATIT